MYDRQPTRYMLPSTNFATGSALEIMGPKGKRGILVDYGVLNPTTTFTTTTTGAFIAVGSGSDPDAYGDEFALGALAADSGGKSVMSTYRRGSDEYNALVLPTQKIAADEKVVVTLTAPTGGTPAGVASPFVDIIWEQ
jgi:hypothetical protein